MQLGDGSSRLRGTFVLTPRIEVIETLANAGFDAVVFDLEHGPYDVPELTPLIAAARGAGMYALVRVGELGGQIGRVLDAGPDGLVVPHVSSAADAARAVAAARFPPHGSRSLNPYVRSAGYGSRPAYTEEADAAVAVLVMVEGTDGLSALDEIVGVPALDGVFVGPIDLAASLGRVGEPEHGSVVRAVRDVLQRVAAADAAPVVYAPTPDAATRWFELGARLVTISADLSMAGDGFHRCLQQVGDRT